MAVRIEPRKINVDDQAIAGTLYIPSDPIGSVLFAHGWGGSQQQYVPRATAVVELGYICLTVDLRGHADREAERSTVSRADNLRDLLAAYDLLAAEATVNPLRIGLVGSSYGAYLHTIVSSVRPVHWLALRAPALYKDDGWDIPKAQLHKDEEFAEYRRRALTCQQNRALSACAAFRGEVLLVESENDQTVPHQVIQNYLTAFGAAASVTHRIVKGADHGLSEPQWQRESTAYLVDWLKKPPTDSLVR